MGETVQCPECQRLLNVIVNERDGRLFACPCGRIAETAAHTVHALRAAMKATVR